jgi:hypothetical protein
MRWGHRGRTIGSEVSEMVRDNLIGTRVAVASPGHSDGASDRTGCVVDVVETTVGTIYVVVWDDGRTTFVPPEAAAVAAAG